MRTCVQRGDPGGIDPPALKLTGSRYQRRGEASNRVLDFEQTRSSALQPVRRILYGIALCFLAALLATEAKVAWVAHTGGFPNDMTAIKLCPVAGKLIDRKAESTPPTPVSRLGSTQASAVLQGSFVIQWGVKPVRRRPLLVSVAEHPCFSPPLFLRPPPSSL